MAEEEKQVEEKPKAEAPVNLGQYQKFLLMDDLTDKLQLLDYEFEFLRKSNSYKPVAKQYFAIARNPGEQFFIFSNLAAWLIRKCGNSNFEMPQEFDDPNATISKILDAMRKLEIKVDFAPNKLKPGAGDQVIYVLDTLSDVALKQSHFHWNRSVIMKEDEGEVVPGVDEAEVTTEQFEGEDQDPEAAEDEDDQEGDFLDLKDIQTFNSAENDSKVEELEVNKDIMVSETDTLTWKLEVERVMPSLKIIIRQDAKDWRAHLEQLEQLNKNLQEIVESTKTQLEKVSTDVTKSMEKINSREKYLNTQLESVLSAFRGAQDRLAEIREKYKEASGGVTERSQRLAQITEELDQTKQEMEERGSNLTDGAPIVKVKQAVQRLEQELIEINVQIGVYEQALLQSQLRDKTYFQHDIYHQNQQRLTN